MKPALAIITVCIMTSWQANAADDSFAPRYPFKNAVITYDEEISKESNKKQVTIEGEKQLETYLMNDTPVWSGLELPEQEFTWRDTEHTFRETPRKSARYYMRLAFNALPPAQQAQLIKNRASLGEHAPLTTYEFYVPSKKMPHKTVAGKETDCYEQVHETGIEGLDFPKDFPISVNTTCYWYGIPLWSARELKGKTTLNYQATNIVLDAALPADLFTVPKNYTRDPEPSYHDELAEGLARDRYNRVVEKLAYKPNVTSKDINYMAPLMGPL